MVVALKRVQGYDRRTRLAACIGPWTGEAIDVGELAVGSS
jgi:hypothetical protein